MAVLSSVIASAMSGVLLWAGLEKARDLAPSASTLRSLGVPGRSAKSAAALVVLGELGAAAGLIFRPDSMWTQAGVATLAGAFALAGMLAWWRGASIRCSCFGSGGSGVLGPRQVVALLPWLAGVALLRLGIEESPSFSDGAHRLAAVGLTLAAWRAVAVGRAWHAARADRRSAQEMFVWLR